MLTEGNKILLTDLGSVSESRVKITSRKEAIALQELAAVNCTSPYRAPELFEVLRFWFCKYEPISCVTFIVYSYHHHGNGIPSDILSYFIAILIIIYLVHLGGYDGQKAKLPKNLPKGHGLFGLFGLFILNFLSFFQLFQKRNLNYFINWPFILVV